MERKGKQKFRRDTKIIVLLQYSPPSCEVEGTKLFS